MGMYKVSEGIAAPRIFADIFSSNSRANYFLPYQSEFIQPLVESVFNRPETISYLGPKIWDLVPLEIKQKEPLTTFKIEKYAKNMLPVSDLFECLMSFRKHLTLRARFIWKQVN